MAGLDPKTPIPTEITLHKKSRMLELSFDDGGHYQLPAEFLRVCSPSAEVRGHGPGQETLQTGTRNVEITALEPVGKYAVQPTFSDGHNTGIYSFPLLRQLCVDGLAPRIGAPDGPTARIVSDRWRSTFSTPRSWGSGSPSSSTVTGGK